MVNLLLFQARKLHVLVLDEVVELVGVDGESVWVIRAREDESSHVGEERMSQRPFLPVAQLRAGLELLLRTTYQRFATR